MDARERWQALQRRLGAARRSLELGDRDQALAEVDAALALDPEFLAAQALRDRILADGPAQRPAPPADDATPLLELDLPLRPAAPPPISETGYAKFEQRAKRRRVDRRLDAARTAIDNGRLHEAGAALDEVLELDPNTPELAALTAALDDLCRARRPPRHGAWLAAALVFGATVLGASWLENEHMLLSRPMQAASALVALPQAPELPADAAPGDVVTDSIGTSGRAAVTPPAPEAVSTMLHAVMPPPASLTPVPQGPLVPLRDVVGPDAAPAAASSSPLSSFSSSSAPPPDTSAAPPPPPAADVPSGVPAAVVPAMMPAVVPAVDETALVKQALQRYRAAYDGLDAGSAQAVWPAVDQGALARAFDGLESQTLTFDACDVQLQNEMATATCRGTARYVPKIGSREPRVEPRVWSFLLRKNGGEWKIDTARVDR